MAFSDSTFQTLAAACEAVVPAKLWLQHKSVVAVSGGADSVGLFRTLVHICKERSDSQCRNLIVGHINHAVRGSESREDRDFVEELAYEFGVKFMSVELDVEELLGQRENISEDTMRVARYRCLRNIAAENDARYLFTGHHLNDQAETILFRIFRGTGLTGLKGIPSLRSDDWLTIVRPFLKVPKVTILNALDSIGQRFCIDATNATNDYGRNFIRNEIMKSAKDYFGLPIEEAIARLADHATDAEAMQKEQVDYFFSQTPPERKTDAVVIKTASMSKLSNALIRAILIRIWQQQQWPVSQMTYRQWRKMAEQISSALGADDHVENLPGNIRFEVSNERVRISS